MGSERPGDLRGSSSRRESWLEQGLGVAMQDLGSSARPAAVGVHADVELVSGQLVGVAIRKAGWTEEKWTGVTADAVQEIAVNLCAHAGGFDRLARAEQHLAR